MQAELFNLAQQTSLLAQIGKGNSCWPLPVWVKRVSVRRKNIFRNRINY